MKKMSKTLLVIMMGASLGACSSMDGKNTFMTYADLQDMVQTHESQWQAVQTKLDRLDELEAQMAALTQGDGGVSATGTGDMSNNDNGDMPNNDSAMNPVAESEFNSDNVAALNVAPAVTASPVISAPLVSTAADTAQTPQTSEYGVQLAAYGIREEAQRGWRVLRDAHPDAFVGLEPLLNEREVNGRTMYQLKIGPFLNKSFSADFCKMLKGKGQDCLLTSYNGQAL